MKLLKELLEQYGHDIKLGPFTLQQERELAFGYDDVEKIWHNVYRDGKHLATLNHNPYEYIDEDTFAKYVAFFKQHRRFPTSEDAGDPGGSLDNKDLTQLVR